MPAILVTAVLSDLFSGAVSSAPKAWEGGTVRFYDESGMRGTVITAAARWNASGAHVRLKEVDSPREADVIIRADDRALRSICGRDCLGYAFSIGRPAKGPTQVLLATKLGGDPGPLSVWVTAHELGHVLGLEHRDGHACSLMSPTAFDTGCAASVGTDPSTPAQLACVPALADVEAAARIYGGAPADVDPGCG